jgi:hypothetical protein
MAQQFHGRNLGKIQRCSRPLCSSQATDEPTRRTMSTTTRQAGGYTHDPVTRVLQKHSSTLPHRRAGRLPQDPTVCLASHHHHDNRVPARDKHRRTSSHPGRETLRQCSTHEQPPQTRTAWAWPLPPAPARRPATPTMWGLMEMSSLERR